MRTVTDSLGAAAHDGRPAPLSAAAPRLLAVVPGHAARTVRRLAHDAALTDPAAIAAVRALLRAGELELGHPAEGSDVHPATLVRRPELARFRRTAARLHRPPTEDSR